MDRPTAVLNVGVIGAGYVGLTTAVVLSSFGFQVALVENNPERLAILQSGKSPIFEPGLDELLTEVLSNGNLTLADRIEEATNSSAVVFIAVGTPSRNDGAADVRAVEEVADTIADSLRHPLVLVIKSTVPVGTSDAIEQRIHVRLVERAAELRELVDDSGLHSLEELCEVVSCPEFLREGKALLDLVHPHRIVVGSQSERAIRVVKKLYRSIDAPVFVTDRRSAEMTKYSSNAFLATKISFINEVANLCELTGANVSDVAHGMGLDARIGEQFLQAGVGYGGSCFPKDTRALLEVARRVQYRFAILESVVEVNERQKLRVVEILDDVLHGLTDKRIALLGLAFKPETDDVREAPSLAIAAKLHQLGAVVVCYDPQAALTFSAETTAAVAIADSVDEAVDGADAVVLLTEWNEFLQLDLRRVRERMRGDTLIDGRNALDPEDARRAGLSYRGIGC